MTTLAVMAATLAACGPGRPEVPTATVPQAPPVTVVVTAVAPDPFAVPAVIDEAYVNRVLAYFDGALGDITRTVIKDRAISAETSARLDSIYIDPEFRTLARESFELDQQEGFAGYFPIPGDSLTKVARLISASAGCIFAETVRDSTKVGRKATGHLTLWVALRPQPQTSNASGWGFTYEGFNEDFSAPDNPCVG